MSVDYVARGDSTLPGKSARRNLFSRQGRILSCRLSQQYENVTLEQSKNVPLTGSGWTGAGRTAIDEPSREGPVGDIAQGEEAGHHASGSSGRVGRERAACEAAIEGAEETR